MNDNWERMTPFQRWLDANPSTNQKLFIGEVLAVALVVQDMVGLLMLVLWQVNNPTVALKTSDLVTFVLEAEHIFVAAYNGIALGQFGWKRATYTAPSPDQQRADVPASPPPAKDAPAEVVVTQPPATPVPVAQGVQPQD